MPVIAPVTPEGLRKALGRADYKVIDEDIFNWVMAKGPNDEPIIVPKIGDLVSVPVMDSIFRRAGDDVRRSIMDEILKESSPHLTSAPVQA